MGIAISNDVKRISITSKRQMTIPQAFFVQLGFGNEAECMIKDNQLIIKPVNEGAQGEFDEEILEDLISQGYTGKELLDRFKEYRRQVHPAVEAMLKEAHLAARGGNLKNISETDNDVRENNGMGKTVYFGQIGKLKSDMIEEYDTLHANCWPHIRKLIQDCNLQNYSIFRHEDMVFSYFEYTGDDFDADMAKMAADEENQRWWEHTHPCFEKYAYGNAEYYLDMKQIFYNE